MGRNTPCSCGSGKKFKHCCLNQQPPQGSTAQAIAAEIAAANDETAMASLEELNAVAARVTAERNRTVHDDFCGLSPDQMHSFLYFPFESPDLVRYHTDIEVTADIPIFRIFTALADAIGDSGLKATARGNLPLSFCKNLAETFKADNQDDPLVLIGGIRSETDFEQLHCTRVLAELAGIISVQRGRFVLTAEGQQFATPEQQNRLFWSLFQAYAYQFNWSCRDAHPEADIVQHAFLFSLFLLQEYGDTSRGSQFYADKFLTAFPAVLALFPESPYSTSERSATHCYTLRTLERFARFFGLVTFTFSTDSVPRSAYTVRKSSLLDQLVTFTL
jgi:hypothetical protein